MRRSQGSRQNGLSQFKDGLFNLAELVRAACKNDAWYQEQQIGQHNPPSPALRSAQRVRGDTVNRKGHHAATGTRLHSKPLFFLF